MLGKVARAVLVVCAASSAAALANDKQDSQAPAPQALGDAELDAITAGAPSDTLTVIISNPGKGNVEKFTASQFVCINCAGSSDKTNGVIITPSGKFIVIPGGPVP